MRINYLGRVATLAILLTAGCSNGGNAAPDGVHGSGSADISAARSEISVTVASPPQPAAPSEESLVDPTDYSSHDPHFPAFGFVTPSGKWLCGIQASAKLAGCASNPNQGPLHVPGSPTVPGHLVGALVEPNVIAVQADDGPSFRSFSQTLFYNAAGAVQTLPYNSTLSTSGFSCNVQESGIACKEDASGSGFTFSDSGFRFEYTAVPADATQPDSPTATSSSSAPGEVGFAPGFPHPPSEEGVQDCGPMARNGGTGPHVVRDNGLIQCAEAMEVMNQFYDAPSIGGPGRVREFGDWHCLIYGAVEAEQLGHGAKCSRQDMATVYLDPE